MNIYKRKGLSRLTKERLIFLSVILLLLVVVFFSVRSCSNNKSKGGEALNLNDAIQDTLVSYRNENKELVSKIKAFELEKTKDFIELKTNDSIIKKLQREVERYKKVIGEGNTVTIFETVTKFDTLIEYVYLDDTITFEYCDEWVDFTGVGNSSLLDFSLTIKEDFTFSVLGKPGDMYVELVNKNPYSDTRYLRSYIKSNKVKKQKIGVGFCIGPSVGYDLIGKDAFVGVGITVGLTWNFKTFGRAY